MIIENRRLIRFEETDIVNGTCTIPNDVLSIDWSAFKDCTSLENIKIPEGVLYIARSAFQNCINLTNVELPTTLTDIGWYAFEGCKSLKTILIPENVVDIGIGTFTKCDNLTHIQWGKDLHRVKCINGDCLEILQKNQLQDYTIYKCQYFTKPDGILWAAEKDGISAYGNYVQDAIRDVQIKQYIVSLKRLYNVTKP